MSRIAFVAALLLVPLLSACGDAADSASSSRIHASAADVTPPLVGSRAPGFVAHHPDGNEFRFDPASLARPVLLVFYRGGWCPYCNAQLLELRKVETQIRTELGYDMLFISADSPQTLSAGVDGNEEAAKYTLLSDNDLDASMAYGVAFRVDDETLTRYREYGLDLEKASGRQHHSLPVPSVFIVNTSGNIAFHYVNIDYRQRIPPELLLTAARVALDERDVRARNATD